jgi:hypothetical protein
MFRYYLALGFGAPTGVISVDPEIILIGRAVAAVVATAFLFYFASSAVLVGAELNAELIRRRRGWSAFPEPARVVMLSLPPVAPSAPASPSPSLFARRPVSGRSARVPTPSPGRRVRVAPTTTTAVDARFDDETSESGRRAP